MRHAPEIPVLAKMSETCTTVPLVRAIKRQTLMVGRKHGPRLQSQVGHQYQTATYFIFVTLHGNVAAVRVIDVQKVIGGFLSLDHLT
jgi:hypothetical protein